MLSNTIVTPTPGLSTSIEFYKSLGFQIEASEKMAYALAKDLVIEIDADRYTRAGIKLIGSNWTDQVAQLKEKTKVVDTSYGHLLNDPNGVRIYLSHESPSVDGTQLHELSSSGLGNYAGVSLESTDMLACVDFYSILGFKVNMGSAEQGWLTMENKDKFSISVMKPNSCPHLFFNPSLTFFNGKNNLKIIEGIRAAGIPITEEITYFNKEGLVDNIIVRDPGGYGFFIFSD